MTPQALRSIANRISLPILGIAASIIGTQTPSMSQANVIVGGSNYTINYNL